MPFQGFSFDESVGRTEPGRARVPEGYYLVECEGMEPTPEDYERTIGIYNKIRIVQGPDAAPGLGIGGRMRDYNALGKADAQFGLGMTLGAYGLEAVAKQLAAQKLVFQPGPAGYVQFQNLCRALAQRATGKRAVALIADQPGQNGRPFSGVEALYPEADWQTYRAAQVLGGNGGPTGGQPAVPRGPQPGAPSVPEGAADLFADLDQAI
jgi:hypothetical protein